MRYDVIIVGARLAGSATATLLARAGLDVLLLDRDRFPSDTLSTHQLQVPGVARLARWGLLDRLVDAGSPATRRVRFEAAGVAIEGSYPPVGDVDALYSPRRTLLDTVLLEAARDAGAEVREAAIVEGLVRDGERVTGVRIRAKAGGTSAELARLVVGADGKHSAVAAAVGSRPVRERPAASLAFYTYWSDVPHDHGWIVNRDRRAVGVWPTDDGLVISYLAWPATELAAYRADPVRAVESTLRGAGELGERVLAGRRAERIRATVDVPNVVRRSAGPGWVLAGDAGLVMDPITGQGMGNALRDADLLGAAVPGALDDEGRLDRALAGYVRRRDSETRAMFDFTATLARLAPSSRADHDLFEGIAAGPGEPDRFLGMLSGSVPVSRYFAPGHLVRLVGVRGFARLVRSRAA